MRVNLPRYRVSLEVDPDDHIGARIIKGRKFYETDLLEDIERRARPGKIIDVGAHIGNHTVYFAGVMNREVISFEPDESNRAQLKGNVAFNDLASRVKILPAAAGSASGFCRTEAMREGNSGMTRVIPGEGTTPIVAIDDLALFGISVIKIDTEGFELEVLRGARETIIRERPLLYIEADGEDRHAAVREFLNNLGYREFGCYAKTPTYGFAPGVRAEKVSLSVAIMAHPKRAAFVEELSARLQGQAKVVWDRNDDRWDTGRRSVLAFDENATHHAVIQDDALVASHLIEGVEKLLQHKPHSPISLYTGKVRPNGPVFARLMQRAQMSGASWLAWPELCWGVGLVFPTSMIEEMIAFCDTKNIANYDSRLSSYLMAKQIPTFYSVPSLVDHRSGEANPSLVPGRTGLNRVAHQFCGEDTDARTLDWSGPAVIDARARTKADMRCAACGAEDYACSLTRVPA